MEYQEHQPAAPLSRYVKCYWTLRDEPLRGEGTADRILPDGCTEWIVQLGDPMVESRGGGGFRTQPAQLIVGQTTQPFVIRPTGNVSTFGVRLWPGAAHLLIGLPERGLTDVAADAAPLLDGPGRLVHAALRGARSGEARCALMDEFLRRRLSGVRAECDPILHTCRSIVGQGGRTSVESLANDVGLSRRQFERRFLAAVGIPPKLLARIVRFRSVFARLAGGNAAVRWADIAASAGYYDQSHLVRDFRQFAGLSPRDYLRQEHALADAILGFGAGARQISNGQIGTADGTVSRCRT